MAAQHEADLGNHFQPEQAAAASAPSGPRREEAPSVGRKPRASVVDAGSDAAHDSSPSARPRVVDGGRQDAAVHVSEDVGGRTAGVEDGVAEAAPQAVPSEQKPFQPAAGAGGDGASLPIPSSLRRQRPGGGQDAVIGAYEDLGGQRARGGGVGELGKKPSSDAVEHHGSPSTETSRGEQKPYLEPGDEGFDPLAEFYRQLEEGSIPSLHDDPGGGTATVTEVKPKTTPQAPEGQKRTSDRAAKKKPPNAAVKPQEKKLSARPVTEREAAQPKTDPKQKKETRQTKKTDQSREAAPSPRIPAPPSRPNRSAAPVLPVEEPKPGITPPPSPRKPEVMPSPHVLPPQRKAIEPPPARPVEAPPQPIRHPGFPRRMMPERRPDIIPAAEPMRLPRRSHRPQPVTEPVVPKVAPAPKPGPMPRPVGDPQPRPKPAPQPAALPTPQRMPRPDPVQQPQRRKTAQKKEKQTDEDDRGPRTFEHKSKLDDPSNVHISWTGHPVTDDLSEHSRRWVQARRYRVRYGVEDEYGFGLGAYWYEFEKGTW